MLQIKNVWFQRVIVCRYEHHNKVPLDCLAACKPSKRKECNWVEEDENWFLEQPFMHIHITLLLGMKL